MSFLEVNKYYLQSFYSKLKGVRDDDRQSIYEQEINKIRIKVKEYYQENVSIAKDNVSIKETFYSDIVNNFGEFEFDYILMNLFLDKDFIIILKSLESNKSFNFLLNTSNKDLGTFIKSLARKLNNTMSVGNTLSNSLQNEFSEFISTNAFTWDEINYNNRSSINHKYAEYLIENISYNSPNWKLIISNHLLFLKSYNYLGYFNSNRAVKSIFFINRLIEYYREKKESTDVKLVQLENKINKNIHHNCFVSYIKTPICISESEASSISELLANRIGDYRDLLGVRVIINEKSYYDLYKSLGSGSIDEFNKALIKKSKLGSLITQDDIENISNFSDSKDGNHKNKARNLIFNKFYIFDKLEF